MRNERRQSRQTSRASGGFVFNYFSIEKVIFPIVEHPVVPGPGMDVSFRRVDAMEDGGFLDLLYTNSTTPFV